MNRPVSDLLIQPRTEGEIAFILGRDLTGPGETPLLVPISAAAAFSPVGRA